ncbi:MAG TPA: hypothetical protein VGW38_21725 [Chloroflexota bacterium]|nr:hypothetical protein [Chloroflexota bacterium]
MDLAAAAQVLGLISGPLIALGLLVAVFSLARRSREQERRIASLEMALDQEKRSNRGLDYVPNS